MNIDSTKIKVVAWIFAGVSIFLAYIAFFSVMSNFTSAASQSQQRGLTEAELNKFSQNNILFYNPGECIEPSGSGGTSSGLCGDTVEEKIWSILKQNFDSLHTAAAFGSIAHEGSFQPVKWQYYDSYYGGGGVVDTSTCDFAPGITWDDLYKGVYDGEYGVGSFQITTGLSNYLHYINDNEPDLLQYFKDPSNTCYSTGDDLAEKIGQSEVDRLLELEVNYFINNWIPEEKGKDIYNAFLDETDLHDAAVYWAKRIEVCDGCGCEVCSSSSELAPRAASAQEYYDKYKDFVCEADSSGTVSGKDIIWIGDSNSVNAGEDLLEKTFPGLKNGGWGPSFDDASSYIEGSKEINSGGASNPSGISILEEIIKEKKLRKYLVFALGDNGGWEQSYIDKIMKLVGDDTKVIFTTNELYCSYHKDYHGGDCIYKQNYTAGNELLRKASEKYKNAYVADIAKKYKDEYFDINSSTIEFNSKGVQMFVDTIKNALVSASSSSSSSTSTSSSSSDSSSSSSSSTGVKWDNGWLVEGSMEGITIENMNDRTSELDESPSGVGTYTTKDGKPNKILLHSTEEIGRDGIKIYPSGNVYPAHFVINLKDKKIWQHFSIYQPSLAIVDHDKSGPIQIEIVGFSTSESDGYKSEWDLKNFSDEDWDYLAKVLLAISEETGIPLTSSVSWEDGAERLSDQAFKDYEGVIGHMHVPGNDHTDPGNIWQYVKEAIERQSGNCYTGDYKDYAYLQYDSRWAGLQYGPTKEDTYLNSACGPTSMATITSIASGSEVLPTDIANLLGNQYYYTVSSNELDPIVCKKYGCEAKAINVGSSSENLSNIKQYLKDGWMIHAQGTCNGGCDNGHCNNCPYSKNGHYVAILDLKDDDTATVSEPGWDGLTEYKLVDLASGATALNAIRGNGSSKSCNNKNNNDNYCDGGGSNSTSSTSSSASNLTEAQAEKLANYYNETDGTYNCTSFVYWFITEFTDLEYGGGNGGDVAHNLAVANNLEEGNEPRPLSVFSVTSIGSTMCEDGLKCGHTGIISSVDGDTLATVEAAYESYNGTVFSGLNKSDFSNDRYSKVYTYIYDHIDMEKLKKVIGD